MQRFAEHYMNILESIVLNPDLQLKDIDMLSEEERKFAPNIYKTLIAAQEMLFSKSVNEIKNQSISFLTQSPLVNLDYFEIVDAGTLKTVEDVNEHKEVVICTAMKVGKIRLIDNVKVSIR